MIEDLPMSKQKAIEAMNNGKKVTHRLFDPDEWMQVKGKLYEFEDGCLCEFGEFWNHRTNDSWLEGWKIFR